MKKMIKRKEGNTHKDLIFYIKLLILSITILGCVFITTSKWKIQSNFPKENFITITLTKVFIEVPDNLESDSSNNSDTATRELDEGYDREVEIYSSQASGISFKNIGGRNYIITADHFCSPVMERYFDVFDKSLIETSFTARDFNGIKYDAEIVYADDQVDLCILSVRERDISDLAVALIPPAVGDQVYTVSAPLGISMEDVALHFDGYFSGCNSSSLCFFTIPATFGSSGSAILDKDNKIVGFILMSTRDINNVSIGPGPEAIRNFLSDASYHVGVDLE